MFKLNSYLSIIKVKKVTAKKRTPDWSSFFINKI